LRLLISHAQYSIGDYKAAASAFRRGLEQDPTNNNLKSGLQNSESRIGSAGAGDSGTHDDTPKEAGSSVPPGDAGLGGMADMLRQFGGGGSGGGGAGGMPDIASIINNPMMMQMAQQLMANGGAEKLMQNPTVANMVCFPFDPIMNDP
jgi:small glutamine-rich tetratricopeptide repeat-containing protein alpha